MVEIAVGAGRLAGFDHGHGGLAPGTAGFLEQDLVARQAEDMVHGIALAPAHQVLAREAAVAAQQDVDVGPSFADHPDDAADLVARPPGAVDVGGSELGEQEMAAAEDVSDLYTEEEKKTSAAYNALPLSHHQNCLTVRLDGPNGSRIVWSFANPVEGDGWSFDQIDMIERLLPQLRQYVRVRQVLGDVDGLNASLATLLDSTADGVIQLDRRGRIVAVNDCARDILKEEDGLFDQGGFLCAHASADHDNLQRLLARALPPSGGQGAGGSMVVTRPPGLSRPVLHVSPVGHRDGDVPPWPVAALVLVVDPNRPLPVDPALVAATLGLSPAESLVAVLLADGNTVRDIAMATGRSENTVRWHIRRIFEKQGITRLVQLVQLVRSLAGLSAIMS